MKLSDLRKKAEKERRKAMPMFLALSTLRGHREEVSTKWQDIADSKVVAWARTRPSIRDYQVRKWAEQIVKMADAIDLYLYAKEHGLKMAALWKLSNE